jgi:hypothetical protein
MKKIYIVLIIFLLPAISIAAVNLNSEQGTFYQTQRGSQNDQNSSNTSPTIDLTNTNDFNLGNTDLTNQLNDNNWFNSLGTNNSRNTKTLPEILRDCGNGKCGFKELFEVVNALLIWAMLGLASTATIMFIYAGFLYMSAQGNTNQIKRAHGIFRVVLIGFVIILLAYLLVQDFLKYFIDPSKSNIYKLFK